YYESNYDISERLGIAETAEMPQSAEFDKYIIGQNLGDYWGFEFPRDMVIAASSDYKASLMLGLRGADIATNNSLLHSGVTSAPIKCGKKCAVNTVTESQKDKDKVIWQEVFPLHRYSVVIGESDMNPA